MIRLTAAEAGLLQRYNDCHVAIGDILPAMEPDASEAVVKLLAYLVRESNATREAVKSDQTVLSAQRNSQEKSVMEKLSASKRPGLSTVKASTAYFEPTGRTREIVEGRGEFSNRTFLSLYNPALRKASKSTLSQLLLPDLKELKVVRGKYLLAALKSAEANESQRLIKPVAKRPAIGPSVVSRPSPRAIHLEGARRPRRPKATVNARMLEVIQSRPDARGWTGAPFRERVEMFRRVDRTGRNLEAIARMPYGKFRLSAQRPSQARLRRGKRICSMTN